MDARDETSEESDYTCAGEAEVQRGRLKGLRDRKDGKNRRMVEYMRQDAKSIIFGRRKGNAYL